jgi:hypothetical protein
LKQGALAIAPSIRAVRKASPLRIMNYLALVRLGSRSILNFTLDIPAL